MAVALIGHGSTNFGTQDGGSLNGVVLTGSDLIVIGVGNVGGITIGSGSISDTNGLTWNALTNRAPADCVTRMFYAYGAGIGAASHNFTIPSLNSYLNYAVAGFSGCLTSGSPFDAENGATTGSGATSVDTGNIAPFEDNELIIACANAGANTTLTYLTLIEQSNGTAAHSYPVTLAFEIQTTATTRKEIFGYASAYYSAGEIASFKSAAGGAGGGTGQPTIQRFGGTPHVGQLKFRGGHMGGAWGRTKDGLIVPRRLAA